MDRNATLNSLLNKFTDDYVKLRQDRKKEALKAWQPIVNAIVEDVKRRDQYGRFARLQILPFGSYYERAKVREPDEFDLMLVMDNLELDGDPYDSGEDDGLSEPPTGTKKSFTASIAIKTFFPACNPTYKLEPTTSIHLAYSLQFYSTNTSQVRLQI